MSAFEEKEAGLVGALWILLSEGAQCLLLASCFPLGSTSPTVSPRNRQSLLSPSPPPQTTVESPAAALHRAGQKPGEGHRVVVVGLGLWVQLPDFHTPEPEV